MRDLTVANTILEQLGGRRFIAMTGAKNLVGGDYHLTFKVGQNAKRVTHVRITLNVLDLYDMEFLRIRGTKVETLKTSNHVYAEDIQVAFHAGTGLYTAL